MFDWCANGQQLKCLTVTDEWTKEGLAIEVDGRIRSGRVIEVLSRLVQRARRAALSALRQWAGVRLARIAEVDHRPWASHTALIDPGKPWQNGATESFNGKFRDECLSLEWFRSRAEAKVADRSVAPALQRGAAAFEPRLSHAGRVRGEARGARRSGRPSDGADRCGMWGLRAPPRRITVPMSEKIRPHHLERKAILYVRQSSSHQVLHNRESSALQYAMRSRLTALGWSNIETVDDDLGRSAAGGVTSRRLRADGCRGLPGQGRRRGAREVSRFARNSSDWQRLIEMCRVVDTV